MTGTDLQNLLDMGFEKERAELAMKRTGSLQDAIDWLDKNQDKPLDDIRKAEGRSEADEGEEEAPALQVGEQARSLVCNECGKKFRGTSQAEWHATKTQHTDFSESTEEIKPLTEEEKKAKLEELKTRLAGKRAGQAEQDKADKKRNEEIRRKATKESQDVREDLQKKERLKEAAAKRREKLEEIEARKRVQAKIEADKAERRRKAELEKAARAGGSSVPHPNSLAAQAPDPSSTSTSSSPSSLATQQKPTAPKQQTSYSEARLRLQTPNGTFQKSFPAETTLFEVAHVLAGEHDVQVTSFMTNFPKKIFDNVEFGMTLKEAGMVPSAAVIVK